MWARTIFSSASTALSVVRPLAIRSCSRQRAVETRRDSGNATMLSRRIDMRTTYRAVPSRALELKDVNPCDASRCQLHVYPLVRKGFLVFIDAPQFGLADLAHPPR